MTNNSFKEWCVYIERAQMLVDGEYVTHLDVIELAEQLKKKDEENLDKNTKIV